jgi:hypothetical protein
MAIPNRDAIEMFAEKLEKLPESVEDDNGNDSYIPKEDFMGEWTALPEMLDDGTFALRLVYELNTKADQPEEWVQDGDLGDRIRGGTRKLRDSKYEVRRGPH